MTARGFVSRSVVVDARYGPGLRRGRNTLQKDDMSTTHTDPRTVLAELEQAAAAKWQGDPSAQRAGLFARAADALRAALAQPVEPVNAPADSLAFHLLAASNYIDCLGGDSKSYRAALAAATAQAQPAITGTPDGHLAQDLSRDLSRALAGKPDAMRHAREAAAAIGAQAQPAAVPVAWDWLRGVMDGIPTREERIGGQRQQYVAKEAVMGWLAEGQSRAERAAQVPAVPAPAVPDGADLLAWAVARWNEEVADRPLVNIHRRTLDGKWRQFIRRLGGDPEALLGPCHDALLQAAPHPQAEQPTGGAR